MCAAAHRICLSGLANVTSFLSNDTTLCGSGAEIYLRQPFRYQLEASGKAGPTFAQIAEAARQQQETALGFLLKNGTVVSAPHAGHQQHLGPGDRIIVLANKA